MKLAGAQKSIGQSLTVDVKPNQLLALQLFVSTAQKNINGHSTPFNFIVSEVGGEGEDGRLQGKLHCAIRSNQ